MLTLKMMSGENIPDDDSRKTFMLLAEVLSVGFSRRPGGICKANVSFRTPAGTSMSESIVLDGNCYVMNDAGKTISSFGIAQYVDPTSITDVLERALRKQSSKVDDIVSARCSLASMPAAIAGQGGNKAMHDAIHHLRELGLNMSEVTELLLEPNGFNSQCQPPWSHMELREVVQSAFRYGRQKPTVEIRVEGGKKAAAEIHAAMGANVREAVGLFAPGDSKHRQGRQPR
jgi:antitoxin component of RelBE/YafQ-DinJ toxin-antitoxin module